MFTIFDQIIFFQLKRYSNRVCLLNPNIGPKFVNSVVKGDFRAFEVPLSDIGHLCYPCYSISSNLDLIFLLGVPMVIIFTIKKELGLYLRVHGNYGPKTDFGRFS